MRALRQCDGAHVQCIVMVRVDFWMALTRFMADLHIKLSQAQNQAAVDLFDLPHARNVLGEFGKAYRCLPNDSTVWSKDHNAFLTGAIEELAQDGKVISVRLALFAQMLKGEPWVPATLAKLGKTEEMVFRFLEENFSARTAPPQNRLHELASQAVLKALVHGTGEAIKGQMRARQELVEVSGYLERPRNFADLIRILDQELRLITPTEPEGSADERSDEPPDAHFYQLTHDYLVPSLRSWLTRKQKETRRGRAELRLADRAATLVRHAGKSLSAIAMGVVEDPRPHRRQPVDRAPAEDDAPGRRECMAGSPRWRWTALLAVACVGLVLSHRAAAEREATHIQELVNELKSADPSLVQEIVAKLDKKPSLAEPFLRQLTSVNAGNAGPEAAQTPCAACTDFRDPSHVDPLLEELLAGKEAYILPIRRLLRTASRQPTEKLRDLLRDEKAAPTRRFRAALALADDLPAAEAAWWTEADLKLAAEQLVSSNAEFQPQFRKAHVGRFNRGCSAISSAFRGRPGDRRPATGRRQRAGRVRREGHPPVDAPARSRHA